MAIRLCQLLCSVHESCPDLQTVTQELGLVGQKSRSLHPVLSHLAVSLSVLVALSVLLA